MLVEKRSGSDSFGGFNKKLDVFKHHKKLEESYRNVPHVE